MLLKVVYDPFRTGRLGLVFYYNGLLSYILLTEGVIPGSIINDPQKISDINKVRVKKIKDHFREL